MKDFPLLIEPFKGDAEKAKEMFSKNNNAACIFEFEAGKLPFLSDRKPLFSIDSFYIVPTVKKTTLLYDIKTDCFIKIIQPLTFKRRLISLFSNKGRSLYNLSERLSLKGLSVPEILAYGHFHKGRKPFFVMKRIKGESLYELLLNRKQRLPHSIYIKVMDSLLLLHSYGYWFGDLRVSHIFIKRQEISGFVDIDSIRRNLPYRLRNIAKDLAGLNHPGLLLEKDQKKKLFDYYISRSNISKKDSLLILVNKYTEHRWGKAI